MGTRYEVWAYLSFEGSYDYFLIYGGQHLLPTMLNAFRAKRNGAGCVKVMWR